MWLDQFGEIEKLVFYIFCAVSALNLVLAIANIILSFLSVKSPGSSMDFYVAIGSLAIVTTVLIRGIEPDWSDPEQMETVCEFFPSLLTFGLLWVVGGLLLRCCSLVHYFRKNQDSPKAGRRNEWIPNMWMIILMIVNAALVMIWLLVYELDLRYIGVGEETDEVYECDGDDAEWWRLGMSIGYAALLLLASIMVWPAIHYTRREPLSMESNILSIIIYNLLFVSAAGALIYVFLDTDDNKHYAINGGLMQYGVFFTLLLLLIAKILAARRAEEDD